MTVDGCQSVGQGAWSREKDLPRDERCRRRTRELASACEALGIARHRVLGVPDGAVSRLDGARARREILSEIDAFQPQVLLTFHHEGVSGHPDHVAVARFLDDAFATAAATSGREGRVPPVRLFQWGIPREKSALYQRKNLIPMRPDEIDAAVEIPEAAMNRKIEAIARHETQIAFFESLCARFDYREVSRPEYFHLRRCLDGGDTPIRTRLRDLFEGITL